MNIRIFMPDNKMLYQDLFDVTIVPLDKGSYEIREYKKFIGNDGQISTCLVNIIGFVPRHYMILDLDKLRGQQ